MINILYLLWVMCKWINKCMSKNPLNIKTVQQETLWRRWQMEMRLFVADKKPFQFSSVSQSCLILCYLVNCSTPGLAVHHQLLESTQTHVHWVSDAVQPSHPLSSPTPPALNVSQHQGLFKWVSSSNQVGKVLKF